MSGLDRLAKVERIVDAAEARGALRVVALDVRAVASFTDTFVIATGTSDRHVRSIADATLESLRAADEKPIGVEGYDEGRWVLLDFGDAIVHVFQEEVREDYDLERLWSDAAVLELGEAAQRVTR